MNEEKKDKTEKKDKLEKIDKELNEEKKDKLEKIDEELNNPNISKSEKEKLLMKRQHVEMYSGPLPPPSMLEEYEKIVPGSGKKIIDNGLEESNFRREFNKKNLDAVVSQEKRRDWMAFLIGLVSIICGAWLINSNQYVIGSIFAGSTVISLVGLFLGKTHQKYKQN